MLAPSQEEEMTDSHSTSQFLNEETLDTKLNGRVEIRIEEVDERQPPLMQLQPVVAKNSATTFCNQPPRPMPDVIGLERSAQAKLALVCPPTEPDLHQPSILELRKRRARDKIYY